jgi:hypothetical protein
MPLRRKWRVFGCTLGVLSMLLLLSAGSAFATASVRFVHAVPGAGPATLNLSVEGSGVSSSPVSFGTVGKALEAKPGRAKFTLVAVKGGDPLAATDETLVDGARYTVVALPKKPGRGAQLRVYRDVKSRAGKARLRVIHAGAELGEPDVRVGNRVVAEKVAYGDATDYVDVPPGTSDISITRAGGEGGALATKRDVGLSAGTATTAVVVGSGGKPTQIVTLSDGTAAPKGAPATGFGGMAAGDDSPSRLAVALLFGLFAALMGAGCWALAGRR